MKVIPFTNPPAGGRRIWLVGGSEGIGLAMTKQLLEAKHQLVVSARAAEQHPTLLTLQQSYPTQLFLLNVDVTQKAELPAKIDQAWSFLEGFDTWIYNAGAYIPMTLDEWNLDAFEQMNAINYLGAVYMMHGLLPKFKTQATGEWTPQWLWNISLAGDFGLPYGGGYSAPKAALQNLAESLYPELKQAGIALKVVNHGFVQTRLTAKNDFAMLGLMTPEMAATKIIAALDSHKFEHRFPWNLAGVLGTIKRLPKPWALKITQGMLKNDA